MARRKAAAAADDGEEVQTKKMRKSNFTDADIRPLLSKYLEKKKIFQNEENSAFVIKSQEGEWERIVQALNAQNATLNRTWKEVRKKYYNLASKAKKLRTKQKAQMLMTGGGVVDPDTSARSYDELPFFARFILENILPAVIVDGVAGGFESETATAAAPVEEEEIDESEFDATQYRSTQNGIENRTLFLVLNGCTDSLLALTHSVHFS